MQAPQSFSSLEPSLTSSPYPEDASASSLNWLDGVRRCSQLLFAALEPETLTVLQANDRFYDLLGLSPHAAEPLSLQDHCLETDRPALPGLYRRHILHQVLWQIYGIDLQICRLLDEPALLMLTGETQRYIQVWLRSDRLQITRINPEIDEFANLNGSALNSMSLPALERQLQLDNYRVTGLLLLEGLDVTVTETTRRITQLLIDQDSILKPDKFEQVNQLMQQLFRAKNTFIASIEGEQVRLFMGSVQRELNIENYPLAAIEGSQFQQALASNHVVAVADLATGCAPCEKILLDRGIRSLMVIPLVCQIKDQGTIVQRPIGLVGVVSVQPNRFDSLDCHHAEQLAPIFTTALTVAMRKMVQQRFVSNIHPAVEWRFAQEAERRSWGLPPEPILFQAVYPLYGISDIRGSSAERNRAIQQDLLEQFRLGLAIVEAVHLVEASALVDQIRFDLLDYMARLQEKVTVDTELTGLKYLSDRLEIYFDYFAQCSPAAAAAIAQYRAACNNEYRCVYTARTRYDAALNQINSHLRATWERWQQRMQQIIPHYCDVEATDGIDHMIYTGQSIDARFTLFHLRSLRYEQLRAMCDCARTAFDVQVECDTGMSVTHLVLVQDSTIDIFHDERTEQLFDVCGTHDIRYEIVKKRIDKAVDLQTQTRITQPGMLTLVYSTDDEWREYHQYLRYLARESWIDLTKLETGNVEPLQGVDGLKFARVPVLPVS